MNASKTTFLQENPHIANRMAPATSFEDNADVFSVRSRTVIHTAASGGADTSPGDNDDVSSVSSKSSALSTRSERFSHRFSIEFERSLVQSRVYRNASRNSSNGSFMSNQTSDSRWSHLTGLSMTQISTISVVCLPVYSSELSNGHMYQQDRVIPGGNVTGGGLAVAQLQRLRMGGVRPTTTIRHGLTPVSERGDLLHVAAGKGDNVGVDMLVKTLGIDIESRDTKGYTALHRAVLEGKSANVQLLLDCGANIEAEDEKDSTSLHQAAKGGRTEIVQLLLDRGANIEATQRDGTSLH